MKKNVVFILLFISGIILSLVCLKETPITSLMVYHDRGVYNSYTPEPLVSGERIQGEFIAPYDNLGMVKLRINTFNRMNTTHVVFEIREKGNDIAWATNTYALDRFEDGLLYPFGFPVIANSKGKRYEFIVISPDGTRDNATGFTRGYHNVASQYVYPKSELFHNASLLQTFLLAKMKTSMVDPYIYVYLSLFVIPAAVFWFKLSGFGSLLYMSLVYTYLPLLLHPNTMLYIATATLYVAFYFRLHSSSMYKLAIICLAQIPLAIALGLVSPANRAAILVFFFFLIGGIISVREIKKK